MKLFPFWQFLNFLRGGRGVGLGENYCCTHQPTRKGKIAKYQTDNLISSKKACTKKYESSRLRVSFPLGEKAMAEKKAYVAPKKLPMTEMQRLKELKDLLIQGKGKAVVQKIVDIALNDDHPGQMAALKMCVDRALPVSMFEKNTAQRNAVTINITGLGGEPLTLGGPSDRLPAIPDMNVIEMEPTDG